MGLSLFKNHIYLKNILARVPHLILQREMSIYNFIFLDIETTGLPQEEYNKTKITEMCFTVVQADHVSLGVYPRIQNKLKLCFNPQKQISSTASKITKLTNDLLESQPTFEEKTCSTIKQFLELQKKPLCFVAHNGNYFDYPILKTELYKANCDLEEDILCIDSLQMFRDLEKINLSERSRQSDCVFSLKTRITSHSRESLKDNKDQLIVNNSSIQKNVPIELCDEYDEILCRAVENLENCSQNHVKKIENLTENTPKKSNTSVIYNHINKSNDTPADHLYYMPSIIKEKEIGNIFTNTNQKSNVNTNTSSTVRRKLNFGNCSYKLADVYKRLTNKVNENTHFSEEDVGMLIECAAILGQDFVEWANRNAKKFSDVPMMKPGRKLGS